MELIKDDKLREVSGGWNIRSSCIYNNTRNVTIEVPNTDEVMTRLQESGIIGDYGFRSGLSRSFAQTGRLSREEYAEAMRRANPTRHLIARINNSQYDDLIRRLSEVLD
jgi:hypothetical protein